MLDIVILPHFFHLKNILPYNFNKTCIRIVTLLLVFSISVLLVSSNFTQVEYHQVLFEKKGK